MNKTWRIILLISVILLIIAGVVGLKYYNNIFADNTRLPENKKSVYLFIPTGSTYENIRDTISPYLKDMQAFDWVAEHKNYPSVVKSGRYKITDGMSNNEIINMLRAGNQAPVDLTFASIRTLDQLAGRISGVLEPDSASFAVYFASDSVAEHYGFNEYSFPAMFIPNTYNIYWNTSPKNFCKRMNEEYHRFWNTKRMQKAEKNDLTPVKVSTLASIVEMESKKTDEKPRIAGVYINRLEKGMPLQADPTLVFAIGNFSIRRVLDKHKKIESPYNTYLNPGLPPGPICLPEISSLDAVLNYEKHDYYFFCAKPDYSGYHNFSKTYAQHRQYAALYRRFLNSEGIYR